jgi:acetylglutamate synthase
MAGIKELPFNLLLDKYRKELLNMTRYTTDKQKWYWKKRSDDTYRRLIELYDEANNSGR